MEQLGGTLSITSEVGVGTSVRLWLPEADEPLPEAPEVVEVAPSLAKQATILLVDDDALINSSTKMLLEELGHNVVDVLSAESAIDFIERGAAIDLVITDYAMPGMTGLELATYIGRFRPKLPVLLVTGFADLPSATVPHVATLSKPYRRAQLEAQLGSLLGI
jgi:CheY-like chemotaxis protein